MTTLVLLHGAPGDGSLWAPVAEALRTEARVLTPTLRWFGPGPWDDDGREFGTEAHADQLIQILETVTDRPASVAAWSYSTHVVLWAALRRPDLIARAFLYEPGLHTYLSAADDIAAFAEDAGRAFGPIAEALRSGGPEKAVEALFDSSGGPGSFAQLAEARRQRYLLGARVMTLLMGGGQPPANISADDLARLRVPTAVACGSTTRSLFRIASNAVARAIPRATLVPVADAGHLLPESGPERFAALLDDWLAT